MMGSGTGEQELHEVEEELDGLGKSAEAAIGAEEGVGGPPVILQERQTEHAVHDMSVASVAPTSRCH